MKPLFIICNGTFKMPKKYQAMAKKATILAVDGGIRYCLKLEIQPNILLGDWDSVSQIDFQLAKKTTSKILTYPKEKDKTDLELALDYGVSKNYSPIYIFGALGSDLAHSQANILLLTKYPEDINISIIHGNQEIFMIKKNHTIRAKKGAKLSLIPISKECKGITTEGLRYSLTNGTLFRSYTLGNSNVFTHPQAKITYSTGILLGILYSLR